MCNILEDDFKYIMNSEVDIDKFNNRSILITGATGLIGSLLTRFFLYLNSKWDYKIKIYAVIRNRSKAEEIYKDYATIGLNYIIADLEHDDISVSEKIDYVVHAAAVTKSKMLISKPVDVIKIAVNGTEKLLDLAIRKKVKSVVYLSSMEVYGQPYTQRKIEESDLGSIDLTNLRSCYPESKRLCENLCTAYVHQYGLNVKVARLAQTFGAGILTSENRVFAQFARSVISEKNIVLHTEGNSEGNYVYTADALKAILILLLKGTPGESYNVVNERNHTTIKQMAFDVIANFGSNEQKVIIDIPKENMGYAPEVHMKLSSKKMEELGWNPQFSLTKMYGRLIYWINNR
ncbi:NAD(P)-dependent oxidoreductase [Limosilactobacillus reuteri]|uniref:NAD-dependent epimerase/dehydratase family protein n=1 Tax=Limosilactobacillus reuteri TaxID=1598 RepID=UPI00235EF688|nr:NAD(P)-dependent oxidoreductase [Limosilactobacillus reuteri]MDD1401137.1 NAD(P)-dependent oxidoreductase [Limosilactobacillus reuteri]